MGRLFRLGIAELPGLAAAQVPPQQCGFAGVSVVQKQEMTSVTHQYYHLLNDTIIVHQSAGMIRRTRGANSGE